MLWHHRVILAANQAKTIQCRLEFKNYIGTFFLLHLIYCARTFIDTEKLLKSYL